MNNLYKIIGFLFCFSALQGLSQKVDSTLVNGTNYYVYPFAHELTIDKEVNYAMKRRAFVKQSVRCEMLINKTEATEKKEIKRYRKWAKRNRKRYSLPGRSFGCVRTSYGFRLLASFSIKNRGFRFKKAARNNYALFYDPEYDFFSEITPCLDKIPNGKYVQYFEPFVIGDKKGNPRVVTDRIAGYFEINDNQIHGKTVWLGINGDTLMQGSYENGLRVNEWKNIDPCEISFYKGIQNKQLIKTGSWPCTQMIQIQNYSKGLKDGVFSSVCTDLNETRGTECMDQLCGYWEQKIPQNIYDSIHQMYIESDSLQITSLKCTYQSSSVKGKFYPVRYNLIQPKINADRDESQSYELVYNLGKFYTTTLYKNEYSYLRDRLFDPYTFYNTKGGMNRSRSSYHLDDTVQYADIIDSLNLTGMMEGIYEKRYSNGQLMYRLNFINGVPEKEDTIFWNNGKPYDVIHSIAGENELERSIYNYEGNLELKLRYDEKGRFLRTSYDFSVKEDVFLDGLQAKNYEENDFYYYTGSYDSTMRYLRDSVVLNKKWLKADSSVTYELIYFPALNKWVEREFGKNTTCYNERISSFQGKWTNYQNIRRFEGFELITQINCESDQPSQLKDQLIPEKIKNKQIDEKLLKNGELYTGKIQIDFDEKKYKNKNNTEFEIPYVNGFAKQSDPLKQFNMGVYPTDKIRSFFLFSLSADDLFFKNSVDKIEGSFKDGLPDGEWIGYDRKGNILLIIHFKSGKLDGTYVHFKPRTSFLNRKQHKISERNYSDGLLHGDYIEFDVNGLPSKTGGYIYGQNNGAFQVESEFYSGACSFVNGVREGEEKVYLKRPNNQKILFISRTYKGGHLNGEATVYHPNGKVAYQGTYSEGCLDGYFKAYDSLGIVYHEVFAKDRILQIEKIYHESSVRSIINYDLKDSLYFKPEIYPSFNLESLIDRRIVSLPKLIYGGNGKLTNCQVTHLYPNGLHADEGKLQGGNKKGLWKFYNQDGNLRYTIYFDSSIVVINDSVTFVSTGVYTEIDPQGKTVSKRYIIDTDYHYDCPNDQYYYVRRFVFTSDSVNQSLKNAYLVHYYDNGIIQSEGMYKNGMPDGAWKFYDPYGKLHEYGKYVLGRKEGKWLKGDIGKIKYLGDVCIDEHELSFEDFEKENQEKLEVQVIFYKKGVKIKSDSFDFDWKKQMVSGNEWKYAKRKRSSHPTVTPSF